MKKIELVFKLILEELIEKKNKKLTQAGIARALQISISTVNLAINHLTITCLRVRSPKAD